MRKQINPLKKQKYYENNKKINKFMEITMITETKILLHIHQINTLLTN